jgi:hypothetical protein
MRTYTEPVRPTIEGSGGSSATSRRKDFWYSISLPDTAGRSCAPFSALPSPQPRFHLKTALQSPFDGRRRCKMKEFTDRLPAMRKKSRLLGFLGIDGCPPGIRKQFRCFIGGMGEMRSRAVTVLRQEWQSGTSPSWSPHWAAGNDVARGPAPRTIRHDYACRRIGRSLQYYRVCQPNRKR